MPEALFFRLEIFSVTVVNRKLVIYPLDDRNPVSFHLLNLFRIIGHEAYARHPEFLEHFRRHPVIPLVGRKTEGDIRVDCVEACILEGIGADLVHEPDPPPLFLMVQQ